MNKKFKEVRRTFDALKVDPFSAAFSEEILDKKLLVKLKKLKYVKDKQFFKLVNLLENKTTMFEPVNVTRADYVEKREIDRSTLSSFDAPFELVHPDIGNLEFLGKNATFPRYVLVLVDLFSSKVYAYPMKSRKQIRQKLEQFYREVRSKRKGKKMRLQVDQEFQQVKIKDINDMNNVDMFSTALRGGKAFAAEQKIRELKTRISKLNMEKLKISPKKIIDMSVANMNIQTSKKYGLSPDEIEKKALASERFRTVFNMKRLEKTKKVHRWQDEFGKRKYSRKRKKLRDDLFISERVYVLAERIKKKSAPGIFYKQSDQNISYFNKDMIFLVRKKQVIDDTTYYWLKNMKTNKNVAKRFSRSELFALRANLF